MRIELVSMPTGCELGICDCNDRSQRVRVVDSFSGTKTSAVQSAAVGIVQDKCDGIEAIVS